MERYLTFRVGKAAYGIPDAALEMFLCGKKLGPRPQSAAPAVVGTFNLAHQEFLILSLRRLFNLPETETDKVNLVGLKTPQGRYGFTVDAMDEALSFEGGLMSEPPEGTVVEVLVAALPYIKTVVSGYAQGVQKYVSVLDLELLSAPETFQAA